MDTVFSGVPLHEFARRFVIALDAADIPVDKAVWGRRETGAGFLWLVPRGFSERTSKDFERRVYALRHRLFQDMPDLVDVNTAVVGPEHPVIRAVGEFTHVEPSSPARIGYLSIGWDGYEDAIVLKAA